MLIVLMWHGQFNLFNFVSKTCSNQSLIFQIKKNKEKESDIGRDSRGRTLESLQKDLKTLKLICES